MGCIMEHFDEEPVESGVWEGKGMLVAVGIGVVGIAVGIGGIVLASQAQRSVEELAGRLAEAPDKTAELEAAVEDLNDRLESLGSEFMKLRRADQQLQERTRDGFRATAEDIGENRDGLNRLGEVVGEMGERLETLGERLESLGGERRPVARTRADGERRSVGVGDGGDGGAERADSDGGGAVEAEGGIHRVEPGDTFSKIAQEYGVKLAALLAANPEVNPRALQIGQAIVIPEE